MSITKSYLEVLGPGTSRIRADGTKRSMTIVRCACGTVKEINTDSLKKMKSCGCKWLDLHKLPFGEGAMKHYYDVYIDGAKKRGHSFQLTLDDFQSIVLRDCYYCGAEPSREIPAAKRYNGSRLVNGVDRVDNSEGYTMENCVPCCRKCNSVKGACPMNIAKKMAEFAR